MGVGGQRHASAAFTPAKEPVPILQKAGWAPRTVWTGAENLVPTGIRSPDRPARSESLYRLRYPGPLIPCTNDVFNAVVSATEVKQELNAECSSLS
jgi:hypothetical protein